MNKKEILLLLLQTLIILLLTHCVYKIHKEFRFILSSHRYNKIFNDILTNLNITYKNLQQKSKDKLLSSLDYTDRQISGIFFQMNKSMRKIFAINIIILFIIIHRQQGYLVQCKRNNLNLDVISNFTQFYQPQYNNILGKIQNTTFQYNNKIKTQLDYIKLPHINTKSIIKLYSISSNFDYIFVFSPVSQKFWTLISLIYLLCYKLTIMTKTRYQRIFYMINIGLLQAILLVFIYILSFQMLLQISGKETSSILQIKKSLNINQFYNMMVQRDYDNRYLKLVTSLLSLQQMYKNKYNVTSSENYDLSYHFSTNFSTPIFSVNNLKFLNQGINNLAQISCYPKGINCNQINNLQDKIDQYCAKKDGATQQCKIAVEFIIQNISYIYQDFGIIFTVDYQENKTNVKLIEGVFNTEF